MLKLHLGCGKRDFGPDWIHIDGETKYPHVKYHDIVNLPFEDNTVDLIYACHVLEYFDREEGFEVLKEWHRVLKQGGILKIAVPDFDALNALYYEGITGRLQDENRFSAIDNLNNILGPLYGKMKMNNKYIYHKTAYDEGALAKILEEAGFIDIKRYDWHNTEHAHIDDFSQAYIPHMDKENGTLISLNIEAVKS
jgi:predicted SAM-dependent methyltransferase